MNTRDITNKVVKPRMAKIRLCPGDTYLIDKMMREAVTAAIYQVLLDAENGEDIFCALLEALEALVFSYEHEASIDTPSLF